MQSASLRKSKNIKGYSILEGAEHAQYAHVAMLTLICSIRRRYFLIYMSRQKSMAWELPDGKPTKTPGSILFPLD